MYITAFVVRRGERARVKDLLLLGSKMLRAMAARTCSRGVVSRSLFPLRRYMSGDDDDWEFVPQTSMATTNSMRREPEAFRKRSGKLLLDEVKEVLNYEGAFDIVTLDTVMGPTDTMVFASVESSAHLTGIALTFLSILKKRKIGNRSFVDGAKRPGEDWVVVEAGQTIVHVMLPATRARLNLERLWNSSLPPLPTPPGMEPDPYRSPYKHDANWDGDWTPDDHKRERRRKAAKNYMPGKKKRSQLVHQLLVKNQKNNSDGVAPSSSGNDAEDSLLP